MPAGEFVFGMVDYDHPFLGTQVLSLTDYWIEDALVDIDAPSGGLFGGAGVINVAEGYMVSYDAKAVNGNTSIVVDLSDQKAYVMKSGVLVGVSTISSGKAGHDTPTGTFEILEKNVEHYSNLYDDAPMPYMQRLTWDGIALHAGSLPGYPASHGCIRLPHEFAAELFAETDIGTTVTVTS